MHDVAVIADAFGKMPMEALAMLVSLGVLGVAGFAIYAVWSIARQKGRR